MDYELHRLRSRLYREIRGFFDSLDYDEVETPILSPSLIPESCLEVFSTTLDSAEARGRELFLIPSPEVFMKRLIAEYGRSLYQVCKCFRNGEALGRTHNVEFSMLEYYSVGFDAEASIGLTESLFARLLAAFPEAPASLAPPFARLSVAEAFRDLVGIDLGSDPEGRAMREELKKRGMHVAQGADWESLYNQLFTALVEPNLPQPGMVVLYDYPSKVPCLARTRPGGLWKERWELYGRGIELANCYTEEARRGEVEEFFASELRSREALGRRAIHADPRYPERIGGLPPCSGVAMGLDRVLMLLTGKERIESVLSFPLLYDLD
jgi:elongation factor P--(R)-beta-lysine ligase